MNPEVKEKWVAALESGEYKQGKQALKTVEGFCCLGVLCDIHAKETGGEWENNRDLRIGTSDASYLSCEASLPQVVVAWAGLNSANPVVGGDYLAELNDRTDIGFKGIAAIIKEKL